MMRISTKGRYAIRLMYDLALHDTGEMITLKDVSSRQDISEKYLEQIVSVLKRAGYVKSLRGSQGGYRLAKKPSEYTAGMILRLIEGDMAPVACLEENGPLCERLDECASVRLWSMLDEAVKGVIDNVTLQDMLDWGQEKVDTFVI